MAWCQADFRLHSTVGLKVEPSLTTGLHRPTISQLKVSSEASMKQDIKFVADIQYGDEYVQPLILRALEARLPPGSYSLRSQLDLHPEVPSLQIRQYEDISFETLMSHSTTFLSNSYVIRKALIRKHYLSTTVHNWITKNPSSILSTTVKPSCEFELDYAEFLDDALVEAWELEEAFRRNEDKDEVDREWWILKPGMSDRGQGIRLFSTKAELQEIFDVWESERPDSDDEEENADNEVAGGEYILTSQLRHFIAQPYIHKPLLFVKDPRKFHIRSYIVCVGSLKVYVFKPMLALFATEEYVVPSAMSATNLRAHLTNTCLQDGTRDGSVQLFWDLPSMLPQLPATWKESVFSQICEISGELFEAASKCMTIHFQTLPNAFEIFGLDFLVDDKGTAWLLEVNAFPDFKQTGDELSSVISGLWEGVVDMAVRPFFGLDGSSEENMVLAKDLDLGRK